MTQYDITADALSHFTKRGINRLVLKWRDRLWLGHWLIDLELVDNIKDEDLEGGGDGFPTSAAVAALPDYQKATIQLSLKALASASDRFRNRTIAHEMIHVAFSPVKDFIDEVIEALPKSQRQGYRAWWGHERERMTEHFCNVLLEAYNELK